VRVDYLPQESAPTWRKFFSWLATRRSTIRPLTVMWVYVADVGMRFVAERAIAPRDGAVSYVVIDEGYEVHNEASANLRT